MIEKIKSIINETLDLDIKELTSETSFINDLELDSLDIVDLIAAFEDEFNIQIADKDIKTLQTVGDVVNYLEAKNA